MESRRTMRLRDIPMLYVGMVYFAVFARKTDVENFEGYVSYYLNDILDLGHIVRLYSI